MESNVTRQLVETIFNQGLKLSFICALGICAHVIHYSLLVFSKLGLRWITLVSHKWRWAVCICPMFLLISTVYSYLSGYFNPIYLALIPILACAHFLRKPSQAEVSRVLEGPQDLGKQLAWWYFLGYLQPLLSSSHNSKSVQDRMAEYEQLERVELCCYKVVLLLPSSCYLATSSRATWQQCHPLPPNCVDRAGAPRIFNNLVYLLNPDFHLTKQRPMRAVVEYVTGLNVLYEMSTDPGKPIPPQVKQRHYLTFCQELAQLVSQDPLCQKDCLLVPYQDDEAFDLSAHLLHQLTVLCQETSILPSAPEEPES